MSGAQVLDEPLQPAFQWFSSDLHIGHDRILRFCARPYRSLAEMHEGLVARWNERVGIDDEVLLLGDVALGDLDRSLAVVKRLHGRLTLVVGNHDEPFAACGVGREAAEWRYLEAGFAEVLHGVVVVRLAGPGGHLARACHFPVTGDSGDHDRHVDRRPVDDGGWLLHGHCHGRWRQRGRMIDVGLDAWGGALAHASELAELVEAGPADRQPLPWTRRWADD